MLKHVSFLTADADAVAHFYTRLGARVSKDFVTGEGWRRLVLEFAGGGKLQFFERHSFEQHSSERRGFEQKLDPDPHAWMQHVAVHLQDWDATLAALRAAGAVFSRDPGLSPGGNRMAFVLDPDGRQVELLAAE